MNKKLILIICVILSLNGCTRDDICPEGTSTTPLLIITFKDIANPLVAKSVANLTIETDYDESITFATAISTDSIGIPLQTDANSTRYRFIKNAGASNEIIDIYEFTYERSTIYVNRACGFKANYSALAAREDDTGVTDWILNLILLKTTVEDETEAHITILH